MCATSLALAGGNLTAEQAGGLLIQAISSASLLGLDPVGPQLHLLHAVARYARWSSPVVVHHGVLANAPGCQPAPLLYAPHATMAWAEFFSRHACWDRGWV